MENLKSLMNMVIKLLKINMVISQNMTAKAIELYLVLMGRPENSITKII